MHFSETQLLGYWLIHTVWKRDQNRYRELNQHNRKQWILVHFPASDGVNISVQYIRTYCSQSHSLHLSRFHISHFTRYCRIVPDPRQVAHSQATETKFSKLLFQIFWHTSLVFFFKKKLQMYAGVISFFQFSTEGGGGAWGQVETLLSVTWQT